MSKVRSAILVTPCSSTEQDMILLGGPHTSLPEQVVVQRDFVLSGTRIEALPACLSAGRDVRVAGRARVRTMPTWMSAGRDASFRGLAIEQLPELMLIGRDLALPRCTRLRRLPSNLEVPGILDLRGCSALEELPDDLKVGRLLILRGCRALRRLPPLELGIGLDLSGCSALAELPAGLRIGHLRQQRRWGRRRRELSALDLSDCTALEQLPGDLVVNGPIEIAGSGLRGLPPFLKPEDPVLWRGMRVTAQAALDPGSLPAWQILGTPNAELRRFMMERRGLEQVLREARAQVIDEDVDAGGPRRLLHVRIETPRHAQVRAQPRSLRFLECRCPSTGRLYLLQVAPGLTSCRRAAAWMAGFDDPDQYRPLIET